MVTEENGSMRKTKQRQAIQRVFAESEHPLSPEDVLSLASAYAPGLGIATVYRALKALTESGTLKVVDIPGQQSRYEMADLAHHHHFHCNSCDRVYDIHACPGNLEQLAPPGFSVNSHSITLFGSCPEC